MRTAAVLVLLAAPAAYAHEDSPPRPRDCTIVLGPNDRLAREETLVVRAGERVESAIALRGDVVVERGARIEKAVAIGGDVTVERGAVVGREAVAIGGDVVLADGARVGKDAVALGGQVRLERGARVEGAVLGISLQLGEALRSRILAELGADVSSCRVVRGWN